MDYFYYFYHLELMLLWTPIILAWTMMLMFSIATITFFVWVRRFYGKTKSNGNG